VKGHLHYIAFDLSSFDEWVSVRAESVIEWMKVWT
jgi:hypothetical protein